MAQLLLKNGTAIIHNSDESAKAVKTDILIEGNKISKIGTDISAEQVEVIDCTDKIISPGFIDTHHHVWQTQLKGRHGDHTLMQYMPSGNFVGAVFTAEDVFWGQLGGCLEMIDGGTTTVADYAHVNYSPEHNYNAISATAASGLRSSFGYCTNPRLSSTVPFTMDTNGALGGHVVPTFMELAKASPWGDGRVSLGFAFDGFAFLPKEYLDQLMGMLDQFKIPLIQSHITWQPGMPSTPQKLEELGVLDRRFLASHSSMPKEDAELYRKRGVHYSSTPSTELQMGLGSPVIFRDDLGVKDLGSIGVDCHTNNASFIPGEARIGLQSARATRAEIVAKKGKMLATVGHSVEEAFNLGTIRGAHAMKMADKIGSIAEGKLADLVILDANSPSMVCAGIHDPVSAIVLHSSPADIDTVIVDGIVRKQDGKLVNIKLDESSKQVVGKDSLSWKDVAQNLIMTRVRIQKETEKMDFEDGKKKVLEAFGMPESILADP